jgi:hypothetical protein
MNIEEYRKILEKEKINILKKINFKEFIKKFRERKK